MTEEVVFQMILEHIYKICWTKQDWLRIEEDEEVEIVLSVEFCSEEFAKIWIEEDEEVEIVLSVEFCSEEFAKIWREVAIYDRGSCFPDD